MLARFSRKAASSANRCSRAICLVTSGRYCRPVPYQASAKVFAVSELHLCQPIRPPLLRFMTPRLNIHAMDLLPSGLH